MCSGIKSSTTGSGIETILGAFNKKVLLLVEMLVHEEAPNNEGTETASSTAQ